MRMIIISREPRETEMNIEIDLLKSIEKDIENWLRPEEDATWESKAYWLMDIVQSQQKLIAALVCSEYARQKKEKTSEEEIEKR